MPPPMSTTAPSVMRSTFAAALGSSIRPETSRSAAYRTFADRLSISAHRARWIRSGSFLDRKTGGAQFMHLFAKQPDCSHVVEHQAVSYAGFAAGQRSRQRHPHGIHDGGHDVRCTQIYAGVQCAIRRPPPGQGQRVLKCRQQDRSPWGRCSLHPLLCIHWRTVFTFFDTQVRVRQSELLRCG